MTERNSHEIYMAYRYCMAHVVVWNAAGDLESGSAFHVGDGYYVTARHVVDQHLVDFLPYGGPTPDMRSSLGIDVKLPEVLLPVEGTADLAILKTNHEPTLPTYGGDYRPHHDTHVPIGGHLDDWLGDGMTLFDVVMMGYPPIPQARHPVLVAVAGHLNAVVDKYGGGHPTLHRIRPATRWLLRWSSDLSGLAGRGSPSHLSLTRRPQSLDTLQQSPLSHCGTSSTIMASTRPPTQTSCVPSTTATKTPRGGSSPNDR